MNIDLIKSMTKADAQAYFRDLITSYPPHTPFKAESVSLILDLATYHPRHNEKFALQVNTIYWVPYKKAWQLFISFVDGSTDDLSIIKCLDALFASDKTKSYRLEVIRAMRDLCVNQINDYRNQARREGVFYCALTGVVLSDSDCVIDHAYPFTFSTLFEIFMWKHKLNPVKVKTKRAAVGRAIADDDLAANWQAWHRTNARLRTISKQLNQQVCDRDPRQYI